MEFISLSRSPRKEKRYRFTYINQGKKINIHFGFQGGSTYIDHKDKTKRKNYIARHRVRENWDEINAGSLSRWLLWGEHTSLKKNLEDYLDRFKLNAV
jgi:hypothetical protein